MIYCNLKGGLGNMLFQIAATKSIAIDNHTDCSFPNLYHHLAYLDIDSVYNPTLKHTAEYLNVLKNLSVESPSTPVQIISYPFDYTNLQVPSNDVCIDGFFQSEKYFKHNRTAVLEYLNFDSICINPLLTKYGIDVTKVNTAVHIRRGDYLRHPSHHPTQNLEYYLTAISRLNNVTDNFIFFSDDMPWVKANLTSANAIYIDGEKDYIEIKLMSLCNHNIICNSSFSWWGSWMNNHSDKVVIGPKKWFGDSIKHNTGDILPLEYIKL